MFDKEKTGAPNNEEKQARILEKINDALRRLGIKMERRRVVSIPGAEPLAGKRVAIIDDNKELLSVLVPVILSVTEGEGDFVLHKGESAEEVAKEIISKAPEVVLLDYELAGRITGKDVAISLREKGYDGIVLGFSSISRGESEFPSDKVDGVVLKQPADIAGSIRQVAEIVARKN